MQQVYNNYSPGDQEVWRILFERHVENLQNKSCAEYLKCLGSLSPVLNEVAIPNFDHLNTFLLSSIGWKIEVVKGLIPVHDFFELLAKKKFCSSTWLRSKEQLDYLEEPDMFHDIFGHIPLFMDPDYAHFMHYFGQIGLANTGNQSVIDQLQRIYWYTIEFGLIKELDKQKLFGAGIMSSYGEAKHIFEDHIISRPYDLKVIMETPFRTDEIQEFYFEINSFKELVVDLKNKFVI